MRSGRLGGGIPGQAKKVFPVDELEELATRKKKLHEEVVVVSKQQQHVDCDMMSGEQDRLTARTGGSEMSGQERRIISACGVVSGGGVVNGGCGSMVDSDSSSSCGGGGQNLVRTLRLKPTSTSSTSSSQLSLLRHPADETPPRHLLD